jgi:uroporphyrinogen III methyltransferase/synthase
MIQPVYLVGAGPGDPGLITVRGQAVLRRAEVVVADRLVAEEILPRGPSVEVIVRGARRSDLPQEELNKLLVERARAGKRVVRLKGGDPFVFGRGSEEAEALAAAGVPFVVVPGVTAGVAAPACAGIPLTHRGLAGAVAFVTGREAEEKDAGAVDWTALARGATTLVLYMSVSHLEAVARRLVEAGRAPSTPAALIENGTTPSERVVVGTLADIAERARTHEIGPPTLTVVGEVVRLRDTLDHGTARGRRILEVGVSGGWRSEESDPEAAATTAALVWSGVAWTFAGVLRFEDRVGSLAGPIERLPSYRWIAFASGNAVRAFAAALDGAGLDGRALARAKIAAVGEVTARQVKAALALRADCTSAGGATQLAEAILATDPHGLVLVPRAAGGRDELAAALTGAGIPVDAVDAYATVPDPAAVRRAVEEHRRDPFDAIAFRSPRAAAAFLDGSPPLDGVLLGAIGQTTARALEERGLHVDVIPPRPSGDALIAALAAALAARSKLR